MREKLEDSKSKWVKALSLFEELSVDINSPLPQFQQCSIKQLSERFLSAFEFLFSLRIIDEDQSHLSPPSVLNELTSLSNELPRITELLEYLEKLKVAGGVRNFNPANCHLKGADGTTTDLNQFLMPVFTRTNPILERMPLMPASSSEQISALATRTEQLERHGITLEKTNAAAAVSLTAIQKTSTDAEGLLKEVQSVVTTSAESMRNLSQTVTDAATQLGDVKAKVEQIKEINTEAATLEQEVQGYSSKFKAFDNQLESRLKGLELADTETKEFLKKNKQRESQIDELTTKADQMIRGATVAGLSKGFADRATQYGKEALWARLGFYTSIMLLAISAIPLALYIFPVPTELTTFEWAKMFSSAGNISLGGVLGRLVVLGPFIWLASFNSKRFSELSFLYQQYHHKAAVAQSIDGFKREAPSYQEDITAAMFMELRENPTGLLRRAKANEPAPANPFLDKIVNFALKKVGNKAANE